MRRFDSVRWICTIFICIKSLKGLSGEILFCLLACPDVLRFFLPPYIALLRFFFPRLALHGSSRIFLLCAAMGDHLPVNAEDITTLGIVPARRESFPREGTGKTQPVQYWRGFFNVCTPHGQRTNKTTEESRHETGGGGARNRLRHGARTKTRMTYDTHSRLKAHKHKRNVICFAYHLFIFLYLVNSKPKEVNNKPGTKTRDPR